MTENGTCKDHKMLCSEIADLKAKNPVGTVQMWSVVGAFLLVAMAVVGFIWTEQRAIRTRLETYQERILGENGFLPKMDKQMNRMEWALDVHLKAWPSVDNKNKNVKPHDNP